MDYESRKIKWYWLFVYVTYCVAVVYLLFQGNPFLYSHVELRSSLDVGEVVHRLTIPLKPQGPEQLAAISFQSRYNLSRTAVDPLSAPRSKNYVEYEKYPLDLGGEKFEGLSVAQDSSGLYLSGKSPWVIAVGLDGKFRWKYRFREIDQEHALFPVLLDEASAYLVHPDGEVVCLDKTSGEIRWILSLKEDVVANPMLWKGNIVVPVKAPNAVQMTVLNRLTGQVDEDRPMLEIKPGFLLSEAPALAQFIATVDNKVMAINPEDWEILWSVTLTDPVKGPAVVDGPMIFVSTLGAKIVKLDGSKKGKIEWEADLEKPAASAPAFLPIVNRLSVLDTSGGLSTIDAKTGKVYWRMATENHNPLTETWSARLSGKHIEEFKMDWLQKGWAIWTPCSDSRFCIYAPLKGQLISRIQLSGRPMTLPLVFDKRWIFLTQSKPGQYVLSQIVEEAEIKRLKAEAATRNR